VRRKAAHSQNAANAIGRPTKPLNVTAEEKEKLLARRPKTEQALAKRARIVLGCSDGLSNGEVAKPYAPGKSALPVLRQHQS